MLLLWLLSDNETEIRKQENRQKQLQFAHFDVLVDAGEDLFQQGVSYVVRGYELHDLDNKIMRLLWWIKSLAIWISKREIISVKMLIKLDQIDVEFKDDFNILIFQFNIINPDSQLSICINSLRKLFRILQKRLSNKVATMCQKLSFSSLSSLQKCPQFIIYMRNIYLDEELGEVEGFEEFKEYLEFMGPDDMKDLEDLKKANKTIKVKMGQEKAKKMRIELEKLMGRLNTTPIEINRSLRLIRMLDERAVALQATFKQQRRNFIKEAKKIRCFRVRPLPQSFITKAKQLKQKCIEIIAYQKEKKDIADQLHTTLRDHLSRLSKQIKRRYENPTEEQKANKEKEKKEKENLSHKNYYLYESQQCVYCYCGRPSFGQMVACENPFCEKQWFHIECIESKDLPDKWFCKICAKLIQKQTNPVALEFLFKS